MAKDTKKTVKSEVTAPADPSKIKALVRLLSILALLLAITAFLLQLFAVLTHHWKCQVTGLNSILSSRHQDAHADSRIDQNYGLFSREVKLYANNDEQLDVRASTRFPRADDGERAFHDCLSQTTTIRGALLTCSNGVVSSDNCHCRRYAYWNFVIVFEILALILLGIVVFLVALLTTQFGRLLRLAAAGVSLLAFLLLLIGLILILSHLKRETRTIADTYPHIHQRFANKFHTVEEQTRSNQQYQTVLHRALRRDAHETYRIYNLLPGQHAYNDTHFYEYSTQENKWLYTAYRSVPQPVVGYAPNSQQDRLSYTAPPRVDPLTAAAYGEYGPLLAYNTVFDNTRASISWSTVLSILAMILALLLPLILIFSWLQDKKLGPDVKKVTTIVKTEVHSETVPLTKQVHTDYDPHRPIGEAAVTSHHVRPEAVLVRDVIITDQHPPTAYGQPYTSQARYPQEHSFPVDIERSQRT